MLATSSRDGSGGRNGGAPSAESCASLRVHFGSKGAGDDLEGDGGGRFFPRPVVDVVSGDFCTLDDVDCCDGDDGGLRGS